MAHNKYTIADVLFTRFGYKAIKYNESPNSIPLICCPAYQIFHLISIGRGFCHIQLTTVSSLCQKV